IGEAHAGILTKALALTWSQLDRQPQDDSFIGPVRDTSIRIYIGVFRFARNGERKHNPAPAPFGHHRVKPPRRPLFLLGGKVESIGSQADFIIGVLDDLTL